MELYDYEVLEHCNHCNRGPGCEDSVRKCDKSQSMKLECRNPWGSELYTTGMFLSSRNIVVLHRAARRLGLTKDVFYINKPFPKYRLTSDAFDMAILMGAKQIGNDKFDKIMQGADNG